jgi:hypothetical protein
MSDEIVKGKTGTVEKARAIYDYVVGKMTYDKNHQGWGRGSTQHACDVGKGNCTDFHALFNSLTAAQGIASGFEIGLYLPYDRKSEEKLGGYHCWALFRVPARPGCRWTAPRRCASRPPPLLLRRPHVESRDAVDRPGHHAGAEAGRRAAQLLPESVRRGGRGRREDRTELEKLYNGSG